MIILHNATDKDSMNFIDAHGAENVVIDWYKGGREHFENLALHKAISFFPSVVVHVPPHKYQPDEDAEIQDIAGHQRITQKVASLEDVENVIDEVNEVLNKSKSLGLEVAPLTMADLDRSDEYYR